MEKLAITGGRRLEGARAVGGKRRPHAVADGRREGHEAVCRALPVAAESARHPETLAQLADLRHAMHGFASGAAEDVGDLDRALPDHAAIVQQPVHHCVHLPSEGGGQGALVVDLLGEVRHPEIALVEDLEPDAAAERLTYARDRAVLRSWLAIA